jgi:Flp pilus assembly protein TadG
MIGRRNTSGRKASVTLELLLVLPLILFLFLAMVMFSLVETCQQKLVHASAQGCRAAAQGGSHDDVEAAISYSLGSRSLLSNAKIRIESGKHTGDYVLVQISVPARCVIPNLLRFMGFALTDEKLIGQTVMRME